MCHFSGRAQGCQRDLGVIFRSRFYIPLISVTLAFRLNRPSTNLATSRMNIWYHPAFWAVFQNEEVLRNIFSFCDVKDLESIRLVCKKWFRESLSFYRSRKVISLALEPPKELLEDNGNKENWTFNWDKFAELLESDGDDFLQLWTKPYTNFKFYTVKDDEPMDRGENQDNDDGWSEDGDNDGDWEEDGDWNERQDLLPFVIPDIALDIFGAVIIKLHLDFSGLYEGGSLRLFDEAIVNLIFFRVPNLKELFIKEWPSDKYEINSYPTVSLPVQRNLKVLGVHGNIPLTWEEIFSAFPSLQKLRLVEMEHHEFTVPSLFHAIRSRSNSGSGTNKRRLDLDLTVNCDKYCSVWKQDLLRDSLKNFKLNLDGKNKSKIGPGGTVLKWLLLNSQPAIKTLCISNLKARTKKRKTPTFNFSEPAIQLFVQEFVALDKNHLTDFHFLSYLPFLRKLVIKDVSLDKWRWSKPACTSTDPEHKSCRDLVFCSPNCLLRGTMLSWLTEFHFEAELNATSLQSLSTVTPNLKSIASVFTDETIQIIFRCFLSLQQLKILAGSALSDKFLIGGQVGALVQYYSIFPNLTETESTEGTFGWQLYPCRFPVFSNIRNLNNLRTFICEGSVSHYGECPHHRVDDYCCQNSYYDDDECDDDCRRSSIELGDAFVHHGILDLPWLQTVRIEPKSKISEQAEKALRNKILSVDLYRKPKPDNPCAECTKVERCGRCADHYFWDVWEFRAGGCESEYDNDSDFYDSEPANFVNYYKEDQLNQKILRKQKKWARYNYGSVLIT